MLGVYLKRGTYITLVFTLSSVLSRALNFAVLPYVLSRLTLEEFGMWDAYQMFFSLATLLLSSVASSGLIRFYITYKNDAQKQSQVIGTALWLVLALAGLFSVVFGAIFLYAPLAFEYTSYSFIVLPTIICFCLYAMLLAYTRASEQFGRYLFYFCLQNVVATSSMVYGVHAGYGLISFFYASFVSYVIFVPAFFLLLYQNLHFKLPLLYKLIQFAGPLLVYNLLYASFFTIDRSLLGYNAGCETLGLYGLLFRFAQIFQFFTIALMNATPNIFFTAQHEKNSKELLTKLMSYYLAVIAAVAGITMVGTWCGLYWFFPVKYSGLLAYVPLFLISLVLLEWARALQIGFNLAYKTYVTPMLGLLVMGLQVVLFYGVHVTAITTLFMLNTVVFGMYFVVSIFANRRLYYATFVSIQKSVVLFTLFLGWCAVISFLITHQYSPLTGVGLLAVWLLLFAGIALYPDDRASVISYCLRVCCWFERTVVSFIVYGYAWLRSFGLRKHSNNFDENIPVQKHSYTDAIVGKKILVFGPAPPPLGGVSVHIERVVHKLRQQNNTVIVFDTTQQKKLLSTYAYKLLKVLYKEKPDIVYYHTPYQRSSFLELLIVRMGKTLMRYKLCFIEHNCRYLYKQTPVFKRYMIHVLQTIDQHIFIGNTTYKEHCDNTIVRSRYFSVESAFLPPNLSDKEKIVATYPQELHAFLQVKRPLLLVNAFQLSLLDDKDLYGFDMCLQLLADLKGMYPDIGCVFALANIGNQAHYDKLQAYIAQHNLGKHLFFLTGQRQLWPLFTKVDLFLRPTLSDGAAVSVEEALYFKVPVVASDVCARPEDVDLFHVGSYPPFKGAVESQLLWLYAQQQQSDSKNKYI